MIESARNYDFPITNLMMNKTIEYMHTHTHSHMHTKSASKIFARALHLKFLAQSALDLEM